jgi:two-component system, chemotaxis family, CheB/CheR fusion protein
MKKTPERPPKTPNGRLDLLKTKAPFPIIGVGASAGGLDALEGLLGNLTGDPGVAFVIVQHLDPTHKGMMPELLQRMSKLKVVQVKDRTAAAPGTIYVIPPNKDMSILHGVLHLLEPATPRGQRLPIDFFFRSLADDQGELSAGIVLSGMGTDGTLGIKAIKEAGGLVLVQDPAESKFDSMPRSAIDTGLADVVAPVRELFERLIGLLKLPRSAKGAGPALESKSQSGLEKVIILLREQTGQDFSLYKKGTLFRRVERRMNIHQIGRIAQYVRFLQENPQERVLLFKELLIGVTRFFRDPEAWDVLEDKAIPELLAARPEGTVFRAWIPGCSTGEDAYSLAMVFREALERIKPRKDFSLQIFATDLDKDAIDRARQAQYPGNIAADVSPKRLKGFFVKDEGGYRVIKSIRESVIFAVQNVIMEPPFTKIDFLVCRNLMIYFAPELQKRILPLFHYSLNPGGILFLGSAETIGSQTDLFTVVDRKWRIYRHRDSLAQREQGGLLPLSFSVPPAIPREAPISSPAPNLQVLTDHLILQLYSQPTVLVNSTGDILYITGKTGRYLEPAAGKANLNIFAMARDGLQNELKRAFHTASRKKGRVTVSGLEVRSSGQSYLVGFSIQAVEEPDALQGTFIVFFNEAEAPGAGKSVSRGKGTSSRDAVISGLDQEIRRLHEELHGSREEMQTSQEELKASFEELQSTNEELQSTNEELTTSKEEMQSLNEELQTVNAELQSKVDELSRSNNDMKNLLNSTDIATVFLDSELNVQRFTTQMSRIVKLKPRDVGRPMADIASDLKYADMFDDIREVLGTLAFKEKQISTQDGRWFLTRIMPYRTLEDKIDGVVITFMDITESKKLEMELRKARHEIEDIVAKRTRELEQVNKALQEEGPQKD